MRSVAPSSWALPLGLAVLITSGCVGPGGDLRLPIGDTDLDRDPATSYHWSTSDAFAVAGIAFTMHDLDPDVDACSFAIGLSGTIRGSGLGGVTIFVREGLPVRYYRTVFGWISGDAHKDDVKLSDFYLPPIGGNGYYERYLDFSRDTFKNWTRDGLLTRNTTIAVVGVGVSPVNLPGTQMVDRSIVFDLECDSPTRVSLHAAREALLLLHNQFDRGTMAEVLASSYSVVRDAKTERNFTAPRVEVIAGASTFSPDPYQTGSLTVERENNTTTWDLKQAPYPFHLTDGPAHYSFELDRVGREEFLVAAIGWHPVTSLEELHGLSELRS